MAGCGFVNLKPHRCLCPENIRTRAGGQVHPFFPGHIIYVTLHCALEQAVKNQLISRNVCDSVDKPKKSKHEFIPWTTEQTNHFLTSVKNTRLFPVYITEWGTGLRRSELLGLKWEDIDFKKGKLTTRRALFGRSYKRKPLIN